MKSIVYCSIVLLISIIAFVSPSHSNELLSFRNVDTWRVGDTLIYQVENAYRRGEMSYSIRKVVFDTGEAFWLCGDLGYSSSETISYDCNPVHQYLVRKIDGVVTKEYTGIGGVGRGPYPNKWKTVSQITSQVEVPYGKFDASKITGNFYPYSGPVINPINPTVIPMTKWYADGLPIDGLVQKVVEQGTPENPKPLIFRLIQVVRGQ